jgi:hypothetical protein
MRLAIGFALERSRLSACCVWLTNALHRESQDGEASKEPENSTTLSSASKKSPPDRRVRLELENPVHPTVLGGVGLPEGIWI